MEKKDIKSLQEQYLRDDPKSVNYRIPEEVVSAIQEIKIDYSSISEERKQLNFEDQYAETSLLHLYTRDQARKLFGEFGYLGIVPYSTLERILSMGIYNAQKSGDMDMLKNALHTENRLRYGTWLTSHSAYNHSGRFEQVIYAFADCDIDLVKKYLPEKFGLADRKSNNFLRAGSNLVMSMLYANDGWLKESLASAHKFNARKGSAKHDVLVIEYLIALSQADTDAASTLLQDIANTYRKTSWLFNFKNQFLKFFGAYVHGLYYIAFYLLPENKFAEIKPPEHTVFWRPFDEYTKASGFRKGKLSLNLPDNLQEIHSLFD